MRREFLSDLFPNKSGLQPLPKNPKYNSAHGSYGGIHRDHCANEKERSIMEALSGPSYAADVEKQVGRKRRYHMQREKIPSQFGIAADDDQANQMCKQRDPAENCGAANRGPGGSMTGLRGVH